MDFSYKKLLWPEGTLLTQQHFQQWDRLQQSRDQFWYYLNTRKPREGFLSLNIEVTALDFGIFRLNHFQAILKEGRVVGFRANQTVPQPLELDLNAIEWISQPKEGDVLTVYIAIPKGQASHGISGYPKQDILKTRWIAEYNICTDEMDLDRQQEILFGCLNIQLLVNESRDFNKRKSENDLLMAAKVTYLGSGGYALKSEYVPPILQVGASAWLMKELKEARIYLEFIEKSLILKINNIKLSNKPFNSNGNNQLHEWRARELLKVVSVLGYQINVWLSNPTVDPSDAVNIVMQSVLSIRSLSINIKKTAVILSTDGTDLYENFSEVFRSLKNAIQSILPMRQKNIPIIQGPEAWWSSEYLSQDVMNMAELYLSVSFNGHINAIEQFLREVKLSGLKDIQRIITQALPGIPIEYCAENIDLVIDDEKRSYFKINKSGQYWENVKSSGKIALFVSKKFLDVNIKLVAVFENEG